MHTFRTKRWDSSANSAAEHAAQRGAGHQEAPGKPEVPPVVSSLEHVQKSRLTWMTLKLAMADFVLRQAERSSGGTQKLQSRPSPKAGTLNPNPSMRPHASRCAAALGPSLRRKVRRRGAMCIASGLSHCVGVQTFLAELVITCAAAAVAFSMSSRKAVA